MKSTPKLGAYNGHLPTAHQRRDMCAYSGGWGKMVGGYVGDGKVGEKRLV